MEAFKTTNFIFKKQGPPGVAGSWRHLLDDWGPAVTKYFNLRIITTSFYVSYPFGLKCENIKDDLTPVVGGYDATQIVVSNAMDFIPSSAFNKTILLNKLRTTNRRLAIVSIHIFFYL
jgi:hypothetical protein